MCVCVCVCVCVYPVDPSDQHEPTGARRLHVWTMVTHDETRIPRAAEESFSGLTHQRDAGRPDKLGVVRTITYLQRDREKMSDERE